MWDLVRLTIEDLAETSLEDIPVESKFLLKINFGDHINCRVWTFNIPFMFDEDRECGDGGLLRLVRYPSKLSLFLRVGAGSGPILIVAFTLVGLTVVSASTPLSKLVTGASARKVYDCADSLIPRRCVRVGARLILTHARTMTLLPWMHASLPRPCAEMRRALLS